MDTDEETIETEDSRQMRTKQALAFLGMSENVPFATLYTFYASFPQNEHLANKS